MEILDINKLPLDEHRLRIHRDYLQYNYSGHFIHGQGTEVILDVIRYYGSGQKWLDVAAGPITLFWGLLLSDVKEMHCNEAHPEGLKVLNDFITHGDCPQCYKDVMNMYKIPTEKFEYLRFIERKFLLFDALTDWPEKLNNQYDIITSFGLFGLSKTPSAYCSSFDLMKPALKNRGVAIGANWIRSEKYIKENNAVDNRYLNTSLVENAAKRNNFCVLHLSQETIYGDQNYSGVIVWTLQKND